MKKNNIIFENSSNIAEVNYDDFMKTLSISFKNGKVYDFVGVEQELFEEFKLASSAGKFFHNKIKGKYDFFKNNVTTKDIENKDK